MKAQLWLIEQRIALTAWWRTRRAFRRGHLTLTERTRLIPRTRRRTP